MGSPKYFQKLLVGDLGGVKVNLDRLAVIPQAMVSGVFLRASGISDTGPHNSFDSPKLGIRTPESAHGESCGFHFSRYAQINRRSCPGWD